jgi:LAS superfamily LD-carboxypeptidase LdcB
MLTLRQLIGRDDSHVTPVNGDILLQPEAGEALAALQGDASAAGFDLQVASAFRSFDRQLAIWNAKADGVRPVHDDEGRTLDVKTLAEPELIAAILRFSALPGTSRHHWGSDMDVYDAAAVPADYRVQLTPAEVASGGVFGPLHRWLDERIAADRAHGFYRPYDRDGGGVAPERWHLSFGPLAGDCAGCLTPELLAAELRGAGLSLEAAVLARLPEIAQRPFG